MKDLCAIAIGGLNALRANGADMADCTTKTKETREFNVDGGEFSLFRTLFDDSLVMSGFWGGRKGSASVNRLDDEAVLTAAEQCGLSAAEAAPDICWDLRPATETLFCTVGCPEPDMDRFFFRLRELMEALKTRHPLILVEQLIAGHEKYRVVYRNSKGAAFDVTGGRYEVSIMYSAHDNDRSSSFFGVGVVLQELDKPLLECGSLARDIADVEKQIRTSPVRGKFKGTVVFTPASLNELLAMTLETYAGDSGILSGTSMWKDKLGLAVAGEKLSVSMRPLDPRVVCGERFTSEGYASENYDVIRAGKLQNFMLSQYVANRTGNRRAPADAWAPFVEPGEQSLEEIIASIDRGILVGRLSGGAPGANGEFSMVAKNSFLIDGGKIGDAVSETMISGNLSDLLLNILAVSSATVCDGACCLPWAAFGGVTVSGK